jgi:hypothetical protein
MKPWIQSPALNKAKQNKASKQTKNYVAAEGLRSLNSLTSKKTIIYREVCNIKFQIKFSTD